MATPRFYAAGVILSVNAWTAQLNSGFLQLQTGTQPAVDAAVTGSRVARLTFGATAFPTSTASGGLVTGTANAITSDPSATGGVVGYAILFASNGTTVIGTMDVGTSGASLNLTSLTIIAAATVACSAFSVTQSET